MALVAALALIAAPTLAGSAGHNTAVATPCESELKVLSCVDVFRKGEPAPGRVTPNNNWRIPGLLWADGVLFAFVEQYTRDCHPGVRPTLCRARTRTRHRPRLTSPSPAGRVEPVQGHRHEAL